MFRYKMKILVSTFLLLISISSFAMQTNREMECGQFAVCSGGSCVMTSGDYSYFKYEYHTEYEGTYKLSSLEWERLESDSSVSSYVRCIYSSPIAWISFKTIPNTQWLTSGSGWSERKLGHSATCDAWTGQCAFELIS